MITLKQINVDLNPFKLVHAESNETTGCNSIGPLMLPQIQETAITTALGIGYENDESNLTEVQTVNTK